MRKIIAIMLLFSLLLVFSACATGTPNNSKQNNDDAVTYDNGYNNDNGNDSGNQKPKTKISGIPSSTRLRAGKSIIQPSKYPMM